MTYAFHKSKHSFKEHYQTRPEGGTDQHPINTIEKEGY